MRQEKIGGARDDQLLAKPAAKRLATSVLPRLADMGALGKNGAPLLATKAMPSCEEANWPKAHAIQFLCGCPCGEGALLASLSSRAQILTALSDLETAAP